MSRRANSHRIERLRERALLSLIFGEHDNPAVKFFMDARQKIPHGKRPHKK